MTYGVFPASAFLGLEGFVPGIRDKCGCAWAGAACAALGLACFACMPPAAFPNPWLTQPCPACLPSPTVQPGAVAMPSPPAVSPALMAACAGLAPGTRVIVSGSSVPCPDTPQSAGLAPPVLASNPSPRPEVAAASAGGGGSASQTIGLAVGVALGATGLIAVGLFVMNQRKRRAEEPPVAEPAPAAAEGTEPEVRPPLPWCSRHALSADRRMSFPSVQAAHCAACPTRPCSPSTVAPPPAHACLTPASSPCTHRRLRPPVASPASPPPRPTLRLPPAGRPPRRAPAAAPPAARAPPPRA
jgi:hypothetical protein